MQDGTLWESCNVQYFVTWVILLFASQFIISVGVNKALFGTLKNLSGKTSQGKFRFGKVA